MRLTIPALGIATAVAAVIVFTLEAPAAPKVEALYQQHCAACHGPDLNSGVGGSLIDDNWNIDNTDEAIARTLREGLPEMGMQGFGDILTDEQIRSLVIYLREKRVQAQTANLRQRTAPPDGVITSNHHAFRLETLAEIEGDIFWSIDFLPSGTKLLTEFGGRLRFIRGNEMTPPIDIGEQVVRHGQGGLMEASFHPNYEENGWIYLGFSSTANGDGGGKDVLTRVVRGRVKDLKWVDQEVIWAGRRVHHTTRGVHFGTRFVFDDGYLYFPIGDRGDQARAQDLRFPNGKIFRIHDDGSIPQDNPFVDRDDAIAAIWSYGHRNPQGLDRHPATGQLWSTEHGPRGGDELNRIQRGANYGWPVITHGMNYNGTPITDRTQAPGMEQPIHHWTPSIAVCGIAFYHGNKFPKWRNDLFVTGLKTEQLERIKLAGDTIIEHEVILKDQGRVRDVGSGPDGYLYLILNEQRRVGPSRLVRIVPAP